jgi:hypothetical protein
VLESTADKKNRNIEAAPAKRMPSEKVIDNSVSEINGYGASSPWTVLP